MDYRDMERIRAMKRKKKKRQRQIRIAVMIGMAVLLLLAIGALLYFLVIEPNRNSGLPSVTTTAPSEMTTAPESSSEEEPMPTEVQAVYQKAARMVAMYDYDNAVNYIKEQVPNFEDYPEIVGVLQKAMAEKTMAVKWGDNTQITHIFFHILVWDEKTAFAPSNYSRIDYNQVMTTADEFKKIISAMYQQGYVMVSLSDIASVKTQEDGSSVMTFNPIYLPEGKKPFVLSQDDVCYYEYMLEAGQGVKAADRGDTLTGYATKLVLTEDGKVTNEMVMADGSKSYGSFDMVTIIDDFVEAHPDFSYRGAKGILALTGYNGVLGYRTSYVSYGPGDTTWPSAHISDNPNIEADRAEAKKVADAIKANGWKFASHTWGHMDMSKFTPAEPAEQFFRDTDWWEKEVKTIVGDTDTIIFAYGADIGGWRGYGADNQMYKYLKDKGFDYFCNVDASTPYWVQCIRSVKSEDGSYADDGYFRQGRRNLDGQRLLEDILYPEKERLKDLFDSSAVFSPNRPLPETGGSSFIGVKIPEGFSKEDFLNSLK